MPFLVLGFGSCCTSCVGLEYLLMEWKRMRLLYIYEGQSDECRVLLERSK